MIAIDTNVLYDETGHFYYLSVVGAEEFTGYDVSTEWHNPQARLKKQGRQLHRWLTKSAYNGVGERRNHKDIIEYMIFTNSNDERQTVIDMLTEYCEASWDSDWDRAQYDFDNPTSKMPPAVVDIGLQTQLKYKGYIDFEVPEDEYQVGY